MVKAPKRKPPLENFKAWRKKRGLNQERMAERLEVTQETVSRYERGEIEMTLAVVIAWADALGIAPEMFWRHPDAPKNELAEVALLLDPKARARWARIIKESMEDEEAA